MALVDYSDDSSASESEAQPAPSQPSKRPFPKVVDRAKPGKILVNLPPASHDKDAASSRDEPAAKRAKTTSVGKFAGFNSFLPAPKNANKPSQGKVGVGLKTSSAPGFSRDTDDGEGEPNLAGGFDDGEGKPNLAGGFDDGNGTTSGDVSAPGLHQGDEDKAVKPLGKPLMFKPLSVARGQPKKKQQKKSQDTATMPGQPPPLTSEVGTRPGPAPAPPSKVSLFSMHTEEPAKNHTVSSSYEPMFETGNTAQDFAYAEYTASHDNPPAPASAPFPTPESLDTIADDLHLSAAERRELFGRGGAQSAQNVINFNMDKEYNHNEGIRATGEQQVHNPVRAIVGGGKHSLQQLVRNVNSQRDALEDSFAKGKQKQREAASRYGY